MLNADTHNTILLVEDDLIDIRTVEEVVDRLQINASLFIAQTKDDAIYYLNKCKEYLPSIIFLDIDMPSINGMEFLRTLKENRQYRTIPIVLLTASKESKIQYTFLHSNIAGYLLKSIDSQELRELINILNSCWRTSEVM
ncbi:MAG: response regulator [Chitinophagales bacterium]